MSRRIPNPKGQNSERLNPKAASCAGKETFPSPAAARRVAKRMAKHKDRSRKDGKPRTYRCAYCGQWHISRAAVGSTALKAPPQSRKGRRPKIWDWSDSDWWPV